MNNNKSFIKNQTKNKDWREMKQQWALSTGWKHQPVLSAIYFISRPGAAVSTGWWLQPVLTDAH
jgi:hypothetical protein